MLTVRHCFPFEQVEWTMQVQDGDTTDSIEAGYSEGDYTTYELEEEVPPTLYYY